MREDDWDHYSDPKIKQQKEEETLLQRLLGPRDVVVLCYKDFSGRGM